MSVKTKNRTRVLATNTIGLVKLMLAAQTYQEQVDCLTQAQANLAHAMDAVKQAALDGGTLKPSATVGVPDKPKAN